MIQLEQKNLTIIFYWNDGHKFEGNISQNKFHGKGSFSLINGYGFEGDWDNNKKSARNNRHK